MINYTIASESEFEPGKGKGDVRIKSVENAKLTGTGKLVFDTTAGRVKEMELTFKPKPEKVQTMKLTVGSKDYEANVDQTYTLRIEPAAK